MFVFLLNAATRLIARLPHNIMSHISAFIFHHLDWLPLIVRIKLKVLTLTYLSHIGQAPRYLPDLIRLPSSAISLRPIRSLDRQNPLLWLRHEPLQSLAFRFRTYFLLLRQALKMEKWENYCFLVEFRDQKCVNVCIQSLLKISS